MMTLNLVRGLGLALCVSWLMGCESVVKSPDEIQQQVQATNEQLSQQAQRPALPAEILQELMLPPLLQATPSVAEIRFSIAADHVQAATFFASLVDGTPYSAAIHPDVSGEITLNLNQVTLQEALQVVQSMYGYDIQRTGNVLQVFPAELRTETFNINYLMLTRLGRSRTTINSSSLVDADSDSDSDSDSNSSSGRNSSSSSNSGSSDTTAAAGTVIHTYSESDFWTELERSVRLMLGSAGDGRAVISTPQSGLLTVRAMPSELAQIRDFVNRLQNRVQRQVLLEAKILEVKLSDGYQQGINWTALASGSAGFSGGFNGGLPGNEISQVIGGVFSIGYESSNFNAVIDMLKTQGNVNVLSSPRISAANNQKAVIKVGTDEYFVTEVSTTTTTGNATTTTPEVELTPFFEGIALDVTPQIDDLGAVLLHVHPSVTDISEQTKVINIFGDSLELPLAVSDIREIDTIVRANSGDVVVIGGLMSTLRTQADSKVPILGDIPLMGGLFTNKSEVEEKHELVILIRPTIVETDYGLPLLQQTNDNLNNWYREAQTRFND
ncbi:pilus (MSHA type) biogenesis protein MshL [Neiella sp. HB171785]|uniref:Pilus (MSHA type) biogenesis protein MshL n=1 Tax=Neiella litorisoli TaxID=2771431 RepID=A0A8J6QUQ3_9GAMM|nr:pilus (MSHA type) biogenesis protein MshL [Neiella litorisoli]MBD1391084.1 pilus (MSHA type) biogenesis protein MshL [Neiella litorisoli]